MQYLEQRIQPKRDQMPFATQVPAPILKKDIGVGTLVWYKSVTKEGHTWDCPAIMFAVSPKRRNFSIMAFDDMVRRYQTYHIDVSNSKFSRHSRCNMRLASVAEVDVYLAEHGADKTAAQIIAEVQAAVPYA